MKNIFLLGILLSMLVKTSIASESCSVTPFKKNMIERQQEIWKKVFNWSAKTSDFDIIAYNDNLVVTETTDQHVIFKISPEIKSNYGGILTLVQQKMNPYSFDEIGKPSSSHNFILTGTVVTKYRNDGSLLGHFCQSNLALHMREPGNFYIDFQLMNRDTKQISTARLNGAFYYFYCVEKTQTSSEQCRRESWLMSSEMRAEDLLGSWGKSSYQL